MQKPQLAIVYVDKVDASFFDDFSSEVNQPDLDYLLKETPEPGPFACVEWFIPTVVAGYIGKEYFKVFLNEMGKEHYQSLKSGFSKLCIKTIEQPRLEPFLIGTKGKISQSNPYTMTYSVTAEADNGYSFKLLLPKYTESFNYQLASDKFMEFIADYHLIGEGASASEIIKKSGTPRGTVLVCYNPETNLIEWQDHLPPEIRQRMSKNEKSTNS